MNTITNINYSPIYQLPYLTDKNTGFKKISAYTVHNLYKYNIDYTIIDCRYPYEYDGGHLKNSINIYSISQIEDFVNKNKNKNKNQILIFYCEFSSKRSFKIVNALKNYDRKINIENYPFINYPEIYIIEGGYNKMFNYYKKINKLLPYIKMIDSNYKNEYSTYSLLYKNKTQKIIPERKSNCRKRLDF
jgi:rhodanese-related sulfurtransferase